MHYYLGLALHQCSGHSRTGHTGHMARLASKLARLANRLPGTNVPGWNFGWPIPKFPDARPTLLIFRLIFPRLIFPRFSLASGSVDLVLSRSSRRPLGYATWVEMLVNSSGLSSSEKHEISLLVQNAIHFNHVSVREGGLYTGQVWCFGVWLDGLFADRETRAGSLSKENIALEKWNRLWQVRKLIIFCFGILFLFSFSDTCVSRLCAACAGSIFSPVVYSVGCRQRALSCKERHHGWDGTLDLPGCCCRWVLWLFVSWLALLFLAGNCVIAWLFALIANSPSSPWP